MSASDELTETLRQAQRFGFFGAAPIEEAIAHAEQFLDAIGEVGDDAAMLDMGSGGGLPGLVLAEAFPRARLVLLDRRQKRTDFLERAVARHGFDQVEVWCDDALDVVDAIARGVVAPFDVVTARGFGPPELTLTTAVGCLHVPDRVGVGRIVISEPPSGDRWSTTLLEELGLRSVRVGGVRRFTTE